MLPRGFTLVEMLIVLALVAAVASMGMFASFTLYGRSSAQAERDAAVMLLAHARNGAMNNLYGTEHGFCLDSEAGEYRTFRVPYGPDTLEAAEAHSDAVAVAGIPECGSGKEIVFERISGAVVPVTLRISQAGAAYRIRVNNEGAILW